MQVLLNNCKDVIIYLEKQSSLYIDVILKSYLILFNEWEGVELAKWLHLASL